MECVGTIMKNKSALAIQLALEFVGEHKELFEEWIANRSKKII